MRRLLARFLLLAAVCALPAAASQRPVDWIIAIVDAEVVTFGELIDEIRTAAAAQGIAMDELPPTEAQKFAEQVLEKLITESIILQEAKRRNVAVPPAEIELETNEALKRIRSQFMDDDAFERALALQYLSKDQIREQYAAKAETSLLRKKLINQEVRRRVNVTDSDIAGAYASRQTEYHLRHILVSDSETAGKVRDRWRGGEDFDAIAKSVRNREAADLGWQKDGDLVKPFFDAASALKTGEISDVVRTRFGWHVIELLEKRDFDPGPLDEKLKNQLADEIFSLRFDGVFEEYVNSLRGKAYVRIKEDYLAPLE